MNEQNIIDALNNLSTEIGLLQKEIKGLKNINSELKTQVYELKEYVSGLQ